MVIVGLASKVEKARVVLAYLCPLVWHQVLVAVGGGVEDRKNRRKKRKLFISSSPVRRSHDIGQFATCELKFKWEKNPPI